ncbi:hypothetical protein [Alkalihalobacillus sp. CinArs1]|uniref:hypothetical protein n=1 Tax=Alkalihalobacillus sp. CinArs1 TaxID=2995314 RepID=UPI0022DE5F90|nr:hypothetical protein [Alkalihalobacillus sp. CinArs1]
MILLPTVWLTLLILFYFYQKQYKEELQLLPALDEVSVATTTHPIVGKSVKHQLIESFSSPYSIILVASERCNYCEPELEELLLENRTAQLPVFVAVLDEEGKSDSKYTKYDNEVALSKVEEDTLKKYSIYEFPTLLLVDEKGVVLEASGWNRALFVHYDMLLKGGGRDVE